MFLFSFFFIIISIIIIIIIIITCSLLVRRVRVLCYGLRAMPKQPRFATGWCAYQGTRYTSAETTNQLTPMAHSRTYDYKSYVVSIPNIIVTAARRRQHIVLDDVSHHSISGRSRIVSWCHEVLPSPWSFCQDFTYDIWACRHWHAHSSWHET